MRKGWLTIAFLLAIFWGLAGAQPTPPPDQGTGKTSAPTKETGKTSPPAKETGKTSPSAPGTGKPSTPATVPPPAPGTGKTSTPAKAASTIPAPAKGAGKTAIPANTPAKKGADKSKPPAAKEAMKLGDSEKANLLMIIDKARAYIGNVSSKMGECMQKAQAKNDVIAKDCLSPILDLAKELSGEADSLMVKAVKEIAADDYLNASEDVKRIQIIRAQFEKFLTQALACLSTELREGESTSNLIPPKTTWKPEDLLLPEPSLEPEPYLSIYR